MLRTAGLAGALALAMCFNPMAQAVGDPAEIEASEPFSNSPFAPFFGRWTLKDDQFQQVWDGQTLETLTIPNHFTDCGPVNTSMSVLCVVDAGGFRGHILWGYDSDEGTLAHLSHFGASRLGVGTGRLSDQGDLLITVRFSDEPEGTYRDYVYRWLDADRYSMVSTQFGPEGEPTGNWYGGTFVRVTPVAP